jgi:hypothetical protein
MKREEKNKPYGGKKKYSDNSHCKERNKLLLPMAELLKSFNPFRKKKDY